MAAMLEDQLEEAGTSYLRVFGPEIPEAGFYYAGQNPLMSFMRQRMPNVRIDPDKMAQYLDRFTGLGFKFILKYNGQLVIYSQLNPRVGAAGVQALERTLGMRADTPIIWVNNNKQRSTAGEFFLGQPSRTKAQPIKGGTDNVPDFEQAEPDSDEELPNVDLDSSVTDERMDAVQKKMVERFGEQRFERHIARWPEFTAAGLAKWYAEKGVRVQPEDIASLASLLGTKLKAEKAEPEVEA